jgi:uncharacterized membrane protein
MKGMIIGLIIGVIGILLFIFFDSLKNPLFITVYIGVFIVGSITFLKIKDPVNKITNILFAFFMFMAFFVTNKTYELTLEANKPQLTTQLTTNDLPWGHFVENYEYTVWYNKLNDSSFNLPIHLIINNYGSVPTQIYNIQFKTLCGNNAGLLSIPQNQSSLIKPGEFFELSDDIYINVENGTIKEILPCKVNFWIGGPNFDMVHKTITLVEDKQ